MENLFLLSINFNSDILETNIINVALLVLLLFNVVGAALKTEMFDRKSKILAEVEGAEERLLEATKRLDEASLQSQQASLILSKIEEKIEKARNTIIRNNWKRGLEEMSRIEKAANLAVKYETKKATQQNQETLINLALTNSYNFVKSELEYEDCAALNSKRIKLIPTNL